MDKTQKYDDRLINALKICRMFNKSFDKYYSRPETKRFIRELRKMLDVDESPTAGGERMHKETLVHPQIAVHIAQWASPQLAVELTAQGQEPIITLQRIMDSSNRTTESQPLTAFDKAIKCALNLIRKIVRIKIIRIFVHKPKPR